MTHAPTEREVAAFLHARFVGVAGTALRDEERTKARELVHVLRAVARIAESASKKAPFVLVDAAAGKGYLGLAASELVLRPAGRAHRVVFVERDARRVAQIDAAARASGAPYEVHHGACGDASAYPEGAGLVAALHACGPATDDVLASAVASGAKRVLVLPCCVGKSVVDVAVAHATLASLALPRSAPIAERIVHGVVDGRRLLRLEAAGYEARAVAIVPPTLTPYHIALEGRLVGEPTRMRIAAEKLALAPDGGRAP